MNINAGYIVKTKSGKQGRTRHKDGFINGKMVVYLETPDFKPLLDDKGNQQKILVNKQDIRIIGFSD